MVFIHPIILTNQKCQLLFKEIRPYTYYQLTWDLSICVTYYNHNTSFINSYYYLKPLFSRMLLKNIDFIEP